MSKYKLQNSFIKISDELNNFVHANGKEFYNTTYMSHKDSKSIKYNTDRIKYEINYITSVFLFLLILVNPGYISSSNYIDSLELGLEPEEGSEYFVVPFIAEYINTKMILVNLEWVDYLKKNLDMDI